MKIHCFIHQISPENIGLEGESSFVESYRIVLKQASPLVNLKHSNHPVQVDSSKAGAGEMGIPQEVIQPISIECATNQLRQKHIRSFRRTPENFDDSFGIHIVLL